MRRPTGGGKEGAVSQDTTPGRKGRRLLSWAVGSQESGFLLLILSFTESNSRPSANNGHTIAKRWAVWAEGSEDHCEQPQAGQAQGRFTLSDHWYRMKQCECPPLKVVEGFNEAG